MVKRMKNNVQKWNWNKEQYEPHVIPNSVHAVTFCTSLDEQINCASCYKKITFGEGYTSLELYTPKYGFGYCVCKNCSEEEIARREIWREKYR